MAKQTRADVSIEAEQDRSEPFAATIHPLTGAPILLRDPDLSIVEPKLTQVTCSTPESFAAVVQSLAGANRLVELRDDGTFVYRDALGAQTISTVKLKLRMAETAKVLGLQGCFTCGQRDILRWRDQWPETLVPNCAAADVVATWDALAHYQASGVKEVEVEHNDDRIAVRVMRTTGDERSNLPRLWHGISPYFEGHAAQSVTLRLDVEQPEADPKSGVVTGKLLFVFSLWAPAASEVTAAAMQDALAGMAVALPEFTIIRGEIADTSPWSSPIMKPMIA